MKLDSKRIEQLVDLGSQIVERAKRRGAEVAEVLARESSELSAKVRMGEPELIEEASSRAIGLRVISGGRSGLTYTSDASPAGIEALIESALELAALSQADEFAVPPDASLLERNPPALVIYDETVEEIDAKEATRRALEAEGAARKHDPRIVNSEGASFQRTNSAIALVTSGGFSGGYRGTHVSLDVSPVVDDEGGKKRQGSFWDSRRFQAELLSPAEIGRRSAERALEKLGARKVESCEVPVIFDPEAGRSLLSLLFSCLTGTSIYQRASYLLGKEGELVAHPRVEIVDDPLLPRGPASRPFDGEGLPSRLNRVIAAGKLQGFLLDTYSGRKLGRPSTGSASRGVGGRPSVAPTNFRLLPGDTSPEQILRSTARGLYVTSMMGFGFNAVTGDFSRGAEGFWIEGGEKAFPIGEITISLNFLDLWRNIDALGNDLETKSAFASPTFRVAQMTVAGT